MMQAPPRRVRTVRLTAPREPLVRRGALLLEDALHTASLGAADGGRLVLVRRLDVGVIYPDRAAAAVAIEVERRFRDAEAYAVHGGDAAAALAPAVWFRNETEAHAALAVRLARGEPVSAWYWRLAVRTWSPASSRADGLRAVLHSAARTTPGAAAVVSLVAELHAAGCLDALLAALAPADGAALLLDCGWSAPALPLRIIHARMAAALRSTATGDARRAGAVSPAVGVAERRVIGDAWRAVLVRWAARWGDDDARTLWLAAVALADRASSSLLDPHLPSRAQRTLAAALALSSDAGPARADTARPSAPTTARDASGAVVPGDASSPAAEPVSGLASPENAVDAAASESPDHPVVSVDAERDAAFSDRVSVDVDASTRPANADASHLPNASPSASSADARESATAGAASSSPDAQPFATAAAEKSVGASNHLAADSTPGDKQRASAEIEADDVAAAGQTRASVSGDAEPGVRVARVDRADALSPAERIAHEAVARSDEAKAPEADDAPEPATFDKPRETAAAGLLFLVPVLRLLGIAALLRDHPHLADAQLPARVLRRIARLTGVAADDPMLALFPVSPREPSPLAFEWPAVWEQGIAAPGWTVRRGGGDAARAVLLDGTGRLPLAAWRGDDPDRVAASASPDVGIPVDPRTDCALLVDAWTVAARRWCRRYARMGLTAVVRRPGG
ncbi:MAG TPA: hypothetical protein VFE05_15710, partial [Longimicrobiaceae bacterium]|nr:hypothetical protein [Longimicrobiaceae bacterium]